jgi:hypothetical protein
MTASSHASTCNILRAMSYELRTDPLILNLWRPPKRNLQEKKKKKPRIRDNHSHSLPTPESPLSTLIFLQTMRLEMSPFILHTPGAFSKKKPPASKNQRVTDNRSPPRHTPTIPRAQPVQPAIIAQSHNRTVMQKSNTIYYCHRPLLSNHHSGYSHHNDYNALILDATVCFDCP